MSRQLDLAVHRKDEKSFGPYYRFSPLNRQIRARELKTCPGGGAIRTKPRRIPCGVQACVFRLWAGDGGCAGAGSAGGDGLE